MIPVIEVADFFCGTGLICVPHMDDEALACGGMLSHLPNKTEWHLLYATDGLGSPEPVLPWRDKITPDLGLNRQKEAEGALTVLGIPPENAHFLNLPDGRLYRQEQVVAEAVAYWVDRLRPDHLLIPFRYDRHRDHLTLNHAAGRLVRAGAFTGQITEYFVYYQWRMLASGDVRNFIRPELLFAVDVTAVAHQKRSALDCYKSQTTRFYPWQARPNLTPALLDNVSTAPEIFLRCAVHELSGTSIFNHAALWIRIVHKLEPFLKKRKDRMVAWWRRGVGKK